MTGDRGAVLMVRAAASGAFNFTHFDPRDRHHWARLSLVLDEIERRDRLESDRDYLSKLVVAMARDDMEVKTRTAYHDAIDAVIAGLDSLRFPWRDKAAPKTVDAAKAKADYEAAFGVDLTSEEGKARIEATVAFLRDARAKKHGR